MAIIGRIRIEPARQDDHDRLGAVVESHFERAGGPPDGLMAHLGYPDGEGFMIVEAWRSEDLFRSYVDSLLVPALREAGLEHREPEVSPAWSIARP